MIHFKDRKCGGRLEDTGVDGSQVDHGGVSDELVMPCIL